MRSTWIGSAVLLVLVALVVLRPWENAADADSLPPVMTAEVMRAVDGDTLEVALGERREDVRLIGVDTPETVKPDTPVQCFGEEASAFTHRIADGRQAAAEFGVPYHRTTLPGMVERRDIYGRLLAYVRIGPMFVNAALLRKGFARTLTIAPNDRFAALFDRLETKAARAGRGLWGAC